MSAAEYQVSTRAGQTQRPYLSELDYTLKHALIMLQALNHIKMDTAIFSSAIPVYIRILCMLKLSPSILKFLSKECNGL